MINNALHGLLAIIVFIGACAAVGFLLGQTTGLGVGVLLGVLVVLITLLYADRIVIWALRARPLDHSKAEATYNTLTEICSRFRCNTPLLAVTEAPQPSVTSVGLSSKRRCIIVSVSCFKLYTADELMSLMAIEVANILSTTSFWRSVVAVLGGFPLLMMNYGMHSVSANGNPHQFSGEIGRWIRIVCTPFAGLVSYVGTMPSRQLRSDMRALRHTANLDAMVYALKKLSIASVRIPSPVLVNNPGLSAVYGHPSLIDIELGGSIRSQTTIDSRINNLIVAVKKKRIPVDSRTIRSLSSGIATTSSTVIRSSSVRRRS